MKAWYFSDESRKLRYNDGREIKLGVTHTVDGKPKLCEHGLHASERLIDALKYAPGVIVWYVELDGKMDVGDDKIAAQKRTYLAGGVDISEILREFARKQALSVAHLWKIPKVVRKYLETGNKKLRIAAYTAARAATYAAARAAAYAAANAAAYAAANAAVSAAYAAANDMLTTMVKQAIGVTE